MNPSARPSYFYVFPKGSDFEIREMTDEEAVKLWDRGQRFVDKGRKTLAEAEQVKLIWLSKR
jgi:exonuclease VII small subunit